MTETLNENNSIEINNDVEVPKVDVKRPVGRPRTKIHEEPLIRRGRGRPRKASNSEEPVVKECKARGRPLIGENPSEKLKNILQSIGEHIILTELHVLTVMIIMF